ncbi:unknown [Singapore grouper iridovirus]|uniref:Uncharacterized protein n=1 Tax=Singapore grouper iridovirus TaxID=262968 RepID=Q5YFJ4_9VIRU|nr:hypothetical protein ORF071R [Singapore grouper iridovirus]AAS18086.1 unknown [Singapore grouper iridovirus]WAU86780.1 hypothetical protein ORF071R [Singapore grouper iridovirus]
MFCDSFPSSLEYSPECDSSMDFIPRHEPDGDDIYYNEHSDFNDDTSSVSSFGSETMEDYFKRRYIPDGSDDSELDEDDREALMELERRRTQTMERYAQEKRAKLLAVKQQEAKALGDACEGKLNWLSEDAQQPSCRKLSDTEYPAPSGEAPKKHNNGMQRLGKKKTLVMISGGRGVSPNNKLVKEFNGEPNRRPYRQGRGRGDRREDEHHKRFQQRPYGNPSSRFPREDTRHPRNLSGRVAHQERGDAQPPPRGRSSRGSGNYKRGRRSYQNRT